MSTAGPAAPPAGYLSEESKRRFTLVAGVLGAVFFLAQMVLPMAVMFGLMMPMMFVQELKFTDIDHAALWQDRIWLLEETAGMQLRDPGKSHASKALASVRTDDLASAGPAIPLGETPAGASHALLASGERLWVIGTDATRYVESGSLIRLDGPGRPARTSTPFAYGGLPAVLALGRSTTLSRLEVTGTQARWTSQEVDLRLPAESGALRALEGLEVGGRLHLFAQLCSEAPERCSLVHRELEGEEWQPAAEESCACDWSVVAVGQQAVLVTGEKEQGRAKAFGIVMLGPGGPRTERVEIEGGGIAWTRWRALSSGDRLFLVSGGMPGGLRLKEIADGRVVRSVRRPGNFPFPPNMMLLMLIPQVLPAVLSLILAFVLTSQMRLHRVADYVHEGERRTFASLWQRALAQLVDALPVAAAFAIPAVGMWRMFSDPESLIESGTLFPLWFFGGFLVAFAFAAVVLLAFSYLEGRFGKTPGKWLVGIRVLGTDLRPCGFGRAFLRNLLTFVDGFFNFLVGALMVAFTENWQRLGDFAARTIVVSDRKAGSGTAA
jgi:uncharacterized RDD family membrane protein YckC